MRRDRTIHELYADDPIRAEATIFGRRPLALAAIGGLLGAALPFGRHLPTGLLPAALAQPTASGPRMITFEGKAPMIAQGDRPLVFEAPETLLDDPITPYEKMFLRNNGQMPEKPVGDPKAWKLRVDGEVNTPLELTVGELETRFPMVTLAMQMECGGNGRSFFVPETRGNQWGNGAIANPAWGGVRLADVLQAAGVKPSAVFVANQGADPHLSGAADRLSISRGVPLDKAMEPHTLIVTRMNNEPLPHPHGGPVRLVVPGWPGSCGNKWLTRIWVREKQHDGPGMGGTSYRVPTVPIVPGSTNNGATFRDLQSMPVRSILTNVANGARFPAGTRSIALRGAAWAGEKTVSAVHTSVDFGATWQAMQVAAPANKYAWQRWTGSAAVPTDGYYEVWYRATDSDGLMQPHLAPNWNPQGYGGNPVSRAAILIG